MALGRKWLGWAAAGAVGILLAAGYWEWGPVPKEVRIGADNAPPYSTWYPDGHVEGFAVDILEEAARRARTRLIWTRTKEGGDPSLQAGAVELWPVIGHLPERLKRFHITRPWLRNDYVLASARRRQFRPEDVHDGVRVAFVRGPMTIDRMGRFLPGAVRVETESRRAAVEALCRGAADAALVDMTLLQNLLLARRPADCTDFVFHTEVMRGAAIDLGIGAARGSESVADRLRDEIDSLRSDGFFARRLAYWNPFAITETDLLFREQDWRWHGRIFAVAFGAVLLLAAVLFWQNRLVSSARRAAEQANTAKSDFVANVSHEIRTPLGGVLSTAELLLDEPLPAHQRKWVEVIRDSGRTLLALVNDVLDLKKVEAGQLVLAREPVQVADVVTGAVNTFQPLAERNEVKLECRIAPGVPDWILSDPLRLRQVVSNLVANAVKFTHRGRIDVVLELAEAGLLRLRVTDTGVGIPASVLPQLFEKFVQADPANSKRYGGTGLGLALARAVVEGMGGRISATSRVEEGSVFIAEFPLEQATAPATQATEPSIAAGPAHAARPRVLVAEDNDVNRMLAVALLERAGCEVDTAKDGRQAVERAAASRYDLIFMDCFMPEMDGYEATRELRRRENGDGRVPVVALTAAAMAGERAKAHQAGMDDYLTKPIDRQELVRVLQRWTTPAA